MWWWISLGCEVCNRAKIPIPPAKVGQRTSVYNLIMRYLTSEDIEESDDAGLQQLQQMDGWLKDVLKDIDKKPDANLSKKGEAGGTSNGNKDASAGNKDESPVASGSQQAVNTRVELHKLREFKITGGSVGGSDNLLDYTSLSYQMQEGKALGYSSKEVMAGVIKAMKAGSSIRKYFEGLPGMDEEKFITILRSHYDVKDSITVFNDMSNASQEPTESESNFTLRMMDLRNKVLTLSREEACPMDENVVRRTFFHSLAVGFKRDTIRLELLNFLKDVNQRDEYLLKEISRVVAADRERTKKMKGGKHGTTSVKSLDHVGIGGEKNKENVLLAEIKQLSTKVNELSTVKEEIQELKKQMLQGGRIGNVVSCPDGGNQINGSGNDGNQNRNGLPTRNYRRTRFVKCDQCARTNTFCNHCFHCGSDQHKKIDCPSKNE